VAVAVTSPPRWHFVLVGARSEECMRSILITAVWLQLGRTYFVPNSSSKALSLVGAPRTVHDEDQHSSIATHLLSVIKPIGVSPLQVGRMRRRKGGRSSFEVRFVLRGGSSYFTSPLALCSGWRPVGRMHEVNADYSCLVQLGRIYFLPNSSSKALSLVGAPRTVRDEDQHSSIATHLLSVVKPIGVSPSMRCRV
jgi:hypothetical protein